MALYLSETDIGDLLTMSDVLETLEEMFRARARGEIVNRPRVRVPITAGTYNLMPAGWIERGVVGHKTYTASAKGASFQMVLYAADGSGLLAVMGGGRLSGKIANGVNVGLLNMQTDSVGARPGNNFTVARTSRELRNRSSIGAMFINRSATGSLAHPMTGTARLAPTPTWASVNMSRFRALPRAPRHPACAGASTRGTSIRTTTTVSIN